MYVLVILACVNILSYFFFFRIDFTKERRYTLSALTKAELAQLDSTVHIDVFLEGELPAGFKHLRQELKDLLSEYSSYAHGNLKVRFLNPAGSNPADRDKSFQELAQHGLQATNLSVKTEEGLTQKIIFPAALVYYQGREMPVNFFRGSEGASPEDVLNNSIQELEYAFTSVLSKIRRGGRPFVGFSEGHGELEGAGLADALNALQGFYQPVKVRLDEVDLKQLQLLKVLVIAKPRAEFTEAEKFKIDQFVLGGGRIIWSVDAVDMGLDSLRKGPALAYNYKLNIEDMLFRYGVRINYNLIADMNCAQIPLKAGPGAGDIQMVPWLFFPILMPRTAHPVVKNLDGIRTEFASSIDTILSGSIRKSILLKSSPYHKLITTPATVSLDLAASQPDPRDFHAEPANVAVLLEGHFPAIFRNRPLPAGIPSGNYLQSAKAHSKMLVISDGDIFSNQVNGNDGSPYPMGYDRFSGQQFANRNFFLNAVDFLADDSGIIGLRNKELKVRLLDKVRLRDSRLLWQVVNLGLPIIIIVVLAVVHFYIRRRRI